MSAIQPVALYAVQVPSDGVIVPAAAGAPAGVSNNVFLVPVTLSNCAHLLTNHA